MARVSQFLEEYDGASFRDTPDGFPGFPGPGGGDATTERKNMLGDFPAVSREGEIEAARKAGYELGYRTALDEAEARHAEKLEAVRRDLASEHQRRLSETEQAIARAVDGLFRQYDDWIDRLLESQLGPLLRRALHAEALEQMRSALVDAARRSGMEAVLSGPEELVSTLETMLAEAQLVTRREPGDSDELRARIGGEQLQTRLARIEEQLGHAGLEGVAESGNAL